MDPRTCLMSLGPLRYRICQMFLLRLICQNFSIFPRYLIQMMCPKPLFYPKTTSSMLRLASSLLSWSSCLSRRQSLRI